MWVDAAMKDVAAAQLIPDKHSHIFLMNASELRRRMQFIRDAFNEGSGVVGDGEDGRVHFLHAFAVKANPLQAVLEVAREMDFGLETASLGEFGMARRVCRSADHVIFDSPCKTLAELSHVLQLPCYLNVDNFAELDRVIALAEGRTALHATPISINATVGIRINPQTVTQSANAALATGAAVSKFGIALHDGDNAARIVDYFIRYHDRINLKMIHVHSGSQGLSLETMVAGVKTIVNEIANHPQLQALVEVIDIGGGFPVDFSSDDERLTMKDYVRALRAEVPTLFQPRATVPRRLIITEFGRTVAAKSGVLISTVEYVKQSGGRQIVLQHIGADLAVRTVWQPEKWPLRVCIYDATGKLRSTTHESDNESNKHNDKQSEMLTDVGGPCCNAGCTIARAAHLPLDIQPLHDMIVVHDVGAYYHSSYCYYNMRPMPACYMYEEPTHNATHKLQCVRPAQTVDEVINLFTTVS